MENNVDDLEIKTLDDILSYSTLFDIDRYIYKDGKGNIDGTIFDKYFTFVRPFIKRVKVRNEHKMYDYKPKLLSKALYKTPNLDWILIKINHMSPSRFRMKEYINIIYPDDVETIFNFLSSKLHN